MFNRVEMKWIEMISHTNARSRSEYLIVVRYSRAVVVVNVALPSTHQTHGDRLA